MARRNKRTPATLVAAPSTKTPWYKRVWVVLTVLATVTSTILLKGPEMLSHAESLPSQVAHAWGTYLSWYHDDQTWTGTWSALPEGEVDVGDMHLTDTEMRIEIVATQGRIDGTVATKALCKAAPMENFALLDGKVSGNEAIVTVYDFVGGERKNYARLKLARKDGVLTVTPMEGHTELFPASARLGGNSSVNQKDEDAALAAFCKDERSALMRKVLPQLPKR